MPKRKFWTTYSNIKGVLAIVDYHVFINRYCQVYGDNFKFTVYAVTND